MSIERGPRDGEPIGEGAEQEQIEIPDWLQKKIDTLEVKKTPVPDWLKEEHEKKLVEMQEEIDADIEGLKELKRIERVKKDTIKERFGESTLKDIELTGKRLESCIESHLLLSKDGKEAEEVSAVWSEFLDAVHHCVESGDEKSDTLKDALEKAILRVHGATRSGKRK